ALKGGNRKIILSTKSPCPCGSGRAIEECHLDFDGRLRIHLPSLRPPGPQTNFSHASCYLRGTHDCSNKISREHYISKAVLEQLGRVVRISGASWQPSGKPFETAPNSLTAKILCRRHNATLSPLDTEAGRFFSELTDALSDLDRATLS